GPLGARRGPARPAPPGRGRRLPEPRGGFRPPGPGGPGLRRPAGHDSRVSDGRFRRPGGAARPSRQPRRAGLGPEAGADRRRAVRATPGRGPEVGRALHLGVLRPPPPRRLPPGHEGGRGTALRPPPTSVGAAVKALVTGAGGFVGRALVEHLEACGDTVV